VKSETPISFAMDRAERQAMKDEVLTGDDHRKARDVDHGERGGARDLSGGVEGLV
jgi:hypothetical protein